MNKHDPRSTLIGKIKYEVKLWVLAGAKRMSNLKTLIDSIRQNNHAKICPTQNNTKSSRL
jgi:hypothetical protein